MILLGELVSVVEAGRRVVLATVTETDRSVPRHAGTKMLIFEDGSTRGTIGGGEMESLVIVEAVAALADGRSRTIGYRLVDPDQGDPGVCGGEVRIYLEPYMPTPVIYVVGCGHIGRAIIELAHWLGYRVVATDDRVELVTEEALPLADVRLPGPISQALARFPVTAETEVVVVTRNMVVDLEVLPELLKTPARSIGVMGSHRRWATTYRELVAQGVPETDLTRLRAPLGLELGAETPEEIAVSVLAELVLLRRGGSGEKMSEG